LSRVRQRNNAPQEGVPLDAKQASQLKRFGANVRRERVGLGLTQEKLGERADLNPRTIQKIEAGRLNILLTTIFRLQSALGCTWQQLVGRELKKKAG